MTPIEIQFVLKAKGHSMAEIARGICNRQTNRPVTAGAIRAVIYRHARSTRIERRISLLAGLPLHELWPRWYDDQGRRIKQRGRYHSTAEAAQTLHALRPDLREVA